MSAPNRKNYRQWRKNKKWMNKWNKNSTVPCSSLDIERQEEGDAADTETEMPCRRRHHHHHHRRQHHHHHRHHHNRTTTTMKPTANEEGQFSEQPGRREYFGRSRWAHVTRLPTTASPFERMETVEASFDDVTTARVRTEEE